MAAQISVVPVIAFPQLSVISQEKLQRIAEIRRAMESLEAQLTVAEASVRTALESGASVESGAFKAFLKTSERKNVSWKSIVERELGESYATRVLAATKPDTYTKLVIEA